jgi:predicted small metal-binding protein
MIHFYITKKTSTTVPEVDHMAEVYKIACDPICGFAVQSHEKDETLRIAMAHAKKFHKDVEVTEADLKEMMTTEKV